jgi:hypothetical protein
VKSTTSATAAIIAVPFILLAAVSGAAAQTVEEGLTPLGVYDSGSGEGGSEIVAVDPATDQMFITNGTTNAVDIVSIVDPQAPLLVSSVDVSAYGDGIQSVAVGGGVFAVAVKAADPTANGTVAVFTTAGVFLASHEVGNLPDAIAFTPDGRFIVVANEGEPVCDGGVLDVDPPGSVSVIDTDATSGAVATADFTAYDGTEDALRADGIRIFFPGSSASQDLEPEYVAISPDGATAFVTLQENNAVAVVDIATATVSELLPLGYKDHNLAGNGLDPSNRDDAEAIANWNVLGMYMPDTISAVDIGGATYLVTANEGDSRDYDCYSEEERVKDFALASPPYAVGDEADSNLGRLKTTSAFPSVIDEGDLQQVFAYGARSFTIWDTDGNVVFDSGDQIEQQLVGTGFFNLDGDETDGRSDDKGPEPEAVATGVIDGRTFAFIGLERSGGVMMYDISDPANATFVDYLNTAEETSVGDVSPEGISFIAEEDSPTGEPLLAVSFEVSGTTRLMQVNTDEPPVTATPTTEPVTTEPVTTEPVTTEPVTTAAMPTATPSIPVPTTSSVPTTVANVLPETGGENGGLLTAAALTSIFGILCFWLARRPFRQTN